jgi:hypothetical protein
VVFRAVFSFDVCICAVLKIVVPFRQVDLNRKILFELCLQIPILESHREHEIPTRDIHILCARELTGNVIHVEILEGKT